MPENAFPEHQLLGSLSPNSKPQALKNLQLHRGPRPPLPTDCQIKESLSLPSSTLRIFHQFLMKIIFLKLSRL